MKFNFQGSQNLYVRVTKSPNGLGKSILKTIYFLPPISKTKVGPIGFYSYNLLTYYPFGTMWQATALPRRSTSSRRSFAVHAVPFIRNTEILTIVLFLKFIRNSTSPIAYLFLKFWVVHYKYRACFLIVHLRLEIYSYQSIIMSTIILWNVCYLLFPVS